MKPYYESAGVQIFHGDCRDVLPTLEGVDVVLTDPPYSEHVHGKTRRGTNLPDAFSRPSDLGFCSLTPDLRLFCAQEFAVKTRRWVLVFSDVEMCSDWRQDLTASGLQYIRTGCWVKSNATPQFTGDRPSPGFEAITIAHPPGRKRWNGGGTSAVWEHAIEINRSHRDPRLHTTQKPLALMKQLVSLFSEEGETILDAFAGSGTTLLAAKLLGRKAIGIELEEKYCEIAANRLSQQTLDFVSEPEIVTASLYQESL